MKTSITGFINYKPSEYKGAEEYHFHCIDMEDYGYITVMPYTLEVEIPDDFDPRAKQVEILKEEARNLRVTFQCRITEIERKIGELTALEYTPEAA